MAFRGCRQALSGKVVACMTSMATDSATNSILRSMGLIVPRVAVTARSVVTTPFRCSSWHDTEGDSYQPQRRGAGSGMARPIERRAGDWDCPACGAMVFANRLACYKCHAQRPAELGGGHDGPLARGGAGTYRTRGAGGMGSYEKKPGDWECPECYFANFASRTQCFKCSTPKGYGGFGGGGDGGSNRNHDQDFF